MKVKAKATAKAKSPARRKAKTATKPVAKKSATSKARAKKPVAKKTVAKKPAAKTTVAKKVAAKKPITKVAEKLSPAIQPAWPAAVVALLAKLDEAKAEQIVAIDVKGKSTEADTMVVASGRSNRHVNAIADQAVEALEKQGLKNIRVEGVPQCDWVLVDAGDILLHVFRPEVRSFYNLEKLWSAHVPE